MQVSSETWQTIPSGAFRPRERFDKQRWDDYPGRGAGASVDLAEHELKTTLGWHWILDAFDCERGCLSDLSLMSRVLTDLPAALSLTCVGAPQVFDHQPDEVEDRCLVGLMMIAESHLSIHARPGRGVIHADLFSCVEFDQDQALEFLRDAYRFSHHEEQRLHRGAIPARGGAAK